MFHSFMNAVIKLVHEQNNVKDALQSETFPFKDLSGENIASVWVAASAS